MGDDYAELPPSLLQDVIGLSHFKLERRENDKRSCPRMYLGRRATLVRTRANAATVQSTTTIREISARGIGLVHTASLAVGEKFVILLPRHSGPPAPVRCVTVRCKSGNTGGGEFLIGATFVAILTPDTSKTAPRVTAAAEAAAHKVTVMADVPAPRTEDEQQMEMLRIREAMLGE